MPVDVLIPCVGDARHRAREMRLVVGQTPEVVHEHEGRVVRQPQRVQQAGLAVRPVDVNHVEATRRGRAKRLHVAARMRRPAVAPRLGGRTQGGTGLDINCTHLCE